MFIESWMFNHTIVRQMYLAEQTDKSHVCVCVYSKWHEYYIITHHRKKWIKFLTMITKNITKE